jgi:Mg/Co/Ni transporter MgtE
MTSAADCSSDRSPPNTARAGLALGAILGSIGFLRISLWSAFSDVYGPHWLLVALTVSVSLVGVVLWGTLSGSLLPFLLKRLGFDPAASSAPFVATLVDVTGLVIYFSVALVVHAAVARATTAIARLLAGRSAKTARTDVYTA